MFTHEHFGQNTKAKDLEKWATTYIVAIGTFILAEGDLDTKPQMPIVQ